MIVTLCGSRRFEKEFIEAQRELSRRGVLCFSLAVLPQHAEPNEMIDGSLDKTMADLLYYDRILHSEAILVLGDGYIGDSTAREILWANIKGKKIYRRINHEAWDNVVFKFHTKLDDSSVLLLQAKGRFS